MHFITFVNLLPPLKDQAINKFLQLAREDDNFPITSDIEQLARYLYLKLDLSLTLGFQKCLMMWCYVLNDYKQPDDPGLLDKINRVIDLQDQDPAYPFKR